MLAHCFLYFFRLRFLDVSLFFQQFRVFIDLQAADPETPFDAFFNVIVNCFEFTAKTEKFACLAKFEFNS